MQSVPQGRWLDPGQHAEVVRMLLAHGLIEISEAFDKPLANGGTTDIYVNLRLARNSPAVIPLIAGLYADPLRRLGLDRFVEVPDAVSCFAGHISTMTGLPMVTVRKHPKEGRVANADMIGTMRWNERFAIIDDVVTDGASKIEPYRKCVAATGLCGAPLVVLVDREQGWRKRFAEEGVDMHVWAGMTLHDIRCELIASGAMRRCDPEREKRNPVVVALDGKTWNEILPLIARLRTTGCILKVNDLIFEEGMNLIPELETYGRVMVDFKWHDIPATMGNAAARLRPFAPWAVTVHASAGMEGIKAVAKALEGTLTKVLVVTVLTSFDPAMCGEVYHAKPLDQVLAFAKIAPGAGAHGFVCSPAEVGALKSLYPEATFVVPGVRSPGASSDDQERVDTPANAIAAGADHVVMGRQILGAPDPIHELMRVLSAELKIPGFAP